MIYRSESNDLTVVSNRLLRDTNLSNGAIGLACILMSMRNNEEINDSDIETICKDGRMKILKQLNELEKYGYLIRTQCEDGERWDIVM